MKKVILAVAIIAIAGGYYAYREFNRGVESTADIKSDVTISANELLTAFQTDEEEANTKYIDKVVEVTGEVGHVEVNGRKVNIPSFQVKIGDEVAVREKSSDNAHIQGAFQTSGGRGRPGWLEIVNSDKLIGRVTALPRRDDVDPNIKEQLIVELYSK